MRTLKFLLRKEFIQILRDPAILRVILTMPIVQLIILPFAADYEVKNINLAVVDQDHSTYSRQLVSKMTASGYFRLVNFEGAYDVAMTSIEQDKADLIIVIPPKFEVQLVKESGAKLQLSVNAVNGVKAGLGAARCTGQ